MLADHHHVGNPMLNHGKTETCSYVEPTAAYYFSCKCLYVPYGLIHAVLVASGGTFL